MAQVQPVQVAPGPLLAGCGPGGLVSSSRACSSASTQDVVAGLDLVVGGRGRPTTGRRGRAAVASTTANQRSPPSGHADSRQVVVEGQLEQVAPHDVVVRRRRAVGGWVKSQPASSSWPSRVVAVRQLHVEQVGHQRRGHRVAVVELELGHLVERQVLLVLEQVADPLRAVAVVPVVGEEVGVVAADDRLVGGDDEPLLGVEHARQPVERHVVAGPVVVGAPALGGHRAVVAGLADRDPAGRLVADVALAVGVHEVLAGHGERRRGRAELVPVAGEVELQDRVRGGRRLQRGPRQRDGVAAGRCALGGVVGLRALARPRRTTGSTSESSGPWAVERTVSSTSSPSRTSITSRRGRQRPQPPVVAPAVADHLLQVEVGDVGAEVGEAPGDVGVVADDHAGHPGEGEARDVERAVRADGPAVQPHLHPDAGHADAEVRVVGEQRLAGRGLARRRRPSCCSRCRRPCRGTPAPGRPGRGPPAARRARPGWRGTPGRSRQPAAAGRVLVEDAVDDGALGDDRPPGRRVVGGEQLGHHLRGVHRQRQHPVDLVVHVAAQVPRHRLEPGERVGGGPRLRLVVEAVERRARSTRAASSSGSVCSR